MEMIFLLFCVFAVFSASNCQSFFEDDVERGDEFIDNLLRDMVLENGHEYDPYILEDSVIGFSKKIAFVNVSGEAKLHNGYITGLKTLHRPEHCSVKEVNGRLLVSADLGAGVLDCNYDGTVKFMNFGPTINVRGTISYVETHMEFSVDAKTGKDGELDKFVIGDIKGMSFKVTGLGPLNWVWNYMLSGLTAMFNGFIKNMIEKTVRNHLSERLPRYPFPVDEATDSIETHLPDTQEVNIEEDRSISDAQHLQQLHEMLNTIRFLEDFEL